MDFLITLMVWGTDLFPVTLRAQGQELLLAPKRLTSKQCAVKAPKYYTCQTLIPSAATKAVSGQQKQRFCCFTLETKVHIKRQRRDYVKEVLDSELIQEFLPLHNKRRPKGNDFSTFVNSSVSHLIHTSTIPQKAAY